VAGVHVAPEFVERYIVPGVFTVATSFVPSAEQATDSQFVVGADVAFQV
jgi:hypothetical protein